MERYTPKYEKLQRKFPVCLCICVLWFGRDPSQIIRRYIRSQQCRDRVNQHFSAVQFPILINSLLLSLVDLLPAFLFSFCCVYDKRLFFVFTIALHGTPSHPELPLSSIYSCNPNILLAFGFIKPQQRSHVTSSIL